MPPRRKPVAGSSSSDYPLSKKGKARAAAAKTFDSFDDCMDEAVNLEEKGERYRFGPKALRLYQESEQMYIRALSYAPQSFDATYNLSRLRYILSTTFLHPPHSLLLLRSSIDGYKSCLDLKVEDEVVKLDAGFNLAQALSDLADLLDEQDAADGEPLRFDAVKVLENVARGQEEFLNSTFGQQSIDAEEEVGEMDEDQEEEEEGDGEESDGEKPSTFEISLPTPSTLIDTYILTLTILSTLLSTTNYNEILVNSDQILSTARSTNEAALKTGLDRSVEIVITESALKMSLVELQLPGWQALATETISRLQSFWTQTSPLTEVSNETKIELVCALGDAQSTLALLLYRFSPPSPALGQQIYTLLSSSTQSSTTAITLLPPPTIGSTPQTVDFTPTSSIQLKLSSLSLQRSLLSFGPWENPSAKANWKVLVGNSRTWSKKAADGVGLASLFLPTLPAPLAADGGGWEREKLAQDSILMHLRALWYLSIAGEGGEDVKAFADKIKKSGKVMQRGLKRWLEDLKEEEGALRIEEDVFWNDFGTGLAY